MIRLAGELENPARHRDGDSVVGELLHERVKPFPAGWTATDTPQPGAGPHSPAQQPIPATQLPQLSRLAGRLTRRDPVIDISLPQPLPQRHRMHPEIGGDLLDRHPVFTVAGDPNNVVTELLGIRPCHSDILPARPPGQAISGVTYPCSRPHQWTYNTGTDLLDLFSGNTPHRRSRHFSVAARSSPFNHSHGNVQLDMHRTFHLRMDIEFENLQHYFNHVASQTCCPYAMRRTAKLASWLQRLNATSMVGSETNSGMLCPTHPLDSLGRAFPSGPRESFPEQAWRLPNGLGNVNSNSGLRSIS